MNPNTTENQQNNAVQPNGVPPTQPAPNPAQPIQLPANNPVNQQQTTPQPNQNPPSSPEQSVGTTNTDELNSILGLNTPPSTTPQPQSQEIPKATSDLANETVATETNQASAPQTKTEPAVIENTPTQQQPAPQFTPQDLPSNNTIEQKKSRRLLGSFFKFLFLLFILAITFLGGAFLGDEVFESIDSDGSLRSQVEDLTGNTGLFYNESDSNDTSVSDTATNSTNQSTPTQSYQSATIEEFRFEYNADNWTLSEGTVANYPSVQLDNTVTNDVVTMTFIPKRTNAICGESELTRFDTSSGRYENAEVITYLRNPSVPEMAAFATTYDLYSEVASTPIEKSKVGFCYNPEDGLVYRQKDATELELQFLLDLDNQLRVEQRAERLQEIDELFGSIK